MNVKINGVCLIFKTNLILSFILFEGRDGRKYRWCIWRSM